MTFRIIMAASAVAFVTAGGAQAQDFDPQPIVDLMHLNAGKAKNRPSGAKGQCYMGTFEPSAEARGLSKAVIFTKTSPVVARFSVGGGNTKVADAARGPNRGFSFRIDPNGAGQTEFVMINAPINFSKTPKQMLEFIQVRRPGADGKMDADKVKAFTDANPETTGQGRYLASKPTPGSWVGVNYYGIHAYTLTNAAGANQLMKFKMVPTGGEVNLTEDEAKAKPADYLADDIADRLKTGKPAGFDMMAVMGRAGDHTADVTKQWDGEDARPSVKLGTLKITAVEKNETCDGTIFAPTILADGITGPKDDPMFEIRTPAYAISITNRSN
ncbi:MAG: catalase family peroxidase [Beijerinckiaceae bacterium]